MFYAVTPEPPHRPIYISPTFENFGYPIDAWLNEPDIWDRVIHPDDRDEVLTKTRGDEAGREHRLRVPRHLQGRQCRLDTRPKLLYQTA